MTQRRYPPPLLALTPGTLEAGSGGAGGDRDLDELLGRVESALGGGLRGVLLREPRLPDRELLRAAHALRELLPRDEGWLGLHDRPHLVRTAGADGVHLGFRSLAPCRVRELVPSAVAVGRSTHAGDAPESWQGADYLFHGPVFATPSKQGLQSPVGVEALREFAAAAQLPTWGLGGIDAERAAELSEHGIGVAVLRAVLGADDPAAAARALARA